MRVVRDALELQAELAFPTAPQPHWYLFLGVQGLEDPEWRLYLSCKRNDQSCVPRRLERTRLQVTGSSLWVLTVDVGPSPSV